MLKQTGQLTPPTKNFLAIVEWSAADGMLSVFGELGKKEDGLDEGRGVVGR
jgi:hypothetical protein